MKLIFSQGRRRVAYLVTADIMTSNSEVRARTYQSEMRQAGYAPEFINVVTNDLDKLEQKLETYLEKARFAPMRCSAKTTKPRSARRQF